MSIDIVPSFLLLAISKKYPNLLHGRTFRK
jgi:hypothetical protein